ncbi:MAG: flagellar protein FlaG [Magnetococcales bacterium]|nr:flagellar protein FlaG [Magnetococcales bacterium]NGZ26546.1 flagellar protein FlaG [Magnetococcales bacterium]
MTGIAGVPASILPPVGGDAGASSEVKRSQDAGTSSELKRSQMERAYQQESNSSGKAEPVSAGNLEKMVKDANQSLSAITSLHISLDRENNQMVVQVIDKANDNKIIRQFPSEHVMELSKRIDALRELKGFLFNTKA